MKIKSAGKRGKLPLDKKTILVCVSGSIAAYRSCDLVRQLRAQGADVICILTKASEQFVTPLTFRSISGNPVHTDPFSAPEEWSIVHTSLADRADLIAVCPATADVIARLAAGMADDMVTSVVLASKAPVLIVPAMNDNMYRHPLTVQNIEKLRQIGYRVMEAIEGDLACGRRAVGHIPDNEAILACIGSILNK